VVRGYFFAIGLPQQFPGLVLVFPQVAHLYVVQLAPLPPQHEHPPIFISPFCEIKIFSRIILICFEKNKYDRYHVENKNLS